MHHRTTYMHSNFQQNRVSRSVKTVHTNLLAKQRKLHKFATCNSSLEKSRLLDMHYPISDLQANFEINRSVRYQVTAKRNYLHRQTEKTTKNNRRNYDRSHHLKIHKLTINMFLYIIFFI